MTTKLKDAIGRVKRLSEDEQDWFADLILRRLEAGDALPTWAQVAIREHAAAGTLTEVVLSDILEDVADNADADASLAEGGTPIPWERVERELG